MTVRYRISCSASEIYVLDKSGRFRLTISSNVNPLSFGNRLADYGALDEAIAAADRFCELYVMLKKYGYHLESSDFLKTGSPPIPVRELLDSEVTADLMRERLERIVGETAR